MKKMNLFVSMFTETSGNILKKKKKKTWREYKLVLKNKWFELEFKILNGVWLTEEAHFMIMLSGCWG